MLIHFTQTGVVGKIGLKDFDPITRIEKFQKSSGVGACTVLKRRADAVLKLVVTLNKSALISGINEQEKLMPKCYQLIGVPAAGKSTWVDAQNWTAECAYISSDKWVDMFAREVGKTYNEVFKAIMPTAVELMTKEVVMAREAGRDIIWDQTSVSVKSRYRKFSMLPDYEHIAIVFATPDPIEHAQRLASRPGKTIPKHVLDSMIESFEMPTEAEGFKEIWYAS
jgi:predicted kinase